PRCSLNISCNVSATALFGSLVLNDNTISGNSSYPSSSIPSSSNCFACSGSKEPRSPFSSRQSFPQGLVNPGEMNPYSGSTCFFTIHRDRKSLAHLFILERFFSHVKPIKLQPSRFPNKYIFTID